LFHEDSTQERIEILVFVLYFFFTEEKYWSMKQILITIPFLILFWQCASTTPEKVSAQSPVVHPQSSIRKQEIDMIRVGDSWIKAETVLGKPSEKQSTPQGTTATWWLAEDEDVEEAYYTLKTKPENTVGRKFITITTDPKNKILTKDFLL
jgi:hypothetical protein